MPLVTVSGVASSTIDLQFQTPENTFRAMALLSTIYAARANGTLLVENDPKAPPVGSATVDEYTLGDAGGHRGAGPSVGTVPLGWLGIVDAEYSSIPASIIGADQANETVVAAGSLRFFTAGGSGTVISAQGNNIVSAPDAGGGDWQVYFDNGDNTVYATSGNFLIQADTEFTFGRNLIALGSGNDTVLSWGEDTVVAAPVGNNDVALLHPNSIFYGNSGTTTVTDEGAGNTVVQGTGDETVFAAGGGGLYFGNAGNLTFVSGAGASGTIVAGAGNATVYGGPDSGFTCVVGPGQLLFDGGSGDQTVEGFAGFSGSAVLFAENGGVMNLFGDTANTLIAGTGAATLNGAGAFGDNLYFAGTGNDCIVAGAGANTVIAGPGVDTLVGGSGPNTFEVNTAFAAGGHELIDRWNTQDQLDLIGYGAPTAPGGLPAGAMLSQVGGSALLSLPDGTRVTFLDVARINLSQFHLF